jgi:hypothetical protein
LHLLNPTSIGVGSILYSTAFRSGVFNLNTLASQAAKTSSSSRSFSARKRPSDFRQQRLEPLKDGFGFGGSKKAVYQILKYPHPKVLTVFQSITSCY